jgi:hypothetical protein
MPVHATQKERWEYLASNESMEWKVELDCHCAQPRDMFRAKSLRQRAFDFSAQLRDEELPAESYVSGMNSIHPDARSLIARLGIQQGGHTFRQPPCWGEPIVGACFGNARALMRKFNRILKHRRDPMRFFYNEGIAIGGYTNPMHHA